MARHTTFRYLLEPSAEQAGRLARNAGAARFAFNQCLRLHLDARATWRGDPEAAVPWTSFDLIRAFNSWKASPDAGRVFVVEPEGAANVVTTGLVWRDQVVQEVFEEAAVDLGRALRAWTERRRGPSRTRVQGHPQFRSKRRGSLSFRLRNRHSRRGTPSIRVGEDRPRSVVLPGLGAIRVREDTRKLRRLIANGRGRVLHATVTGRDGRWWVCLTVEAADLPEAQRHRPRPPDDRDGWVGVDRGLTTFLVAATADGTEVARRSVRRHQLEGLERQRRLARDLSRKVLGSRRRRRAASRLRRHHRGVRNRRSHELHCLSTELAKTHDRFVLETLHVRGMMRNHRLARAIADVAWSEFERMLTYKVQWRGGSVALADRWYASSKICSRCGATRIALRLSERLFTCAGCGLSIDRDLNAAVNLAASAPSSCPRDPRAGGPVTNAHRQEHIVEARRAPAIDPG